MILTNSIVNRLGCVLTVSALLSVAGLVNPLCSRFASCRNAALRPARGPRTADLFPSA